MHHNFRLCPLQLFRTMCFHGMKVSQINSVRWKVKYFSQSITKSSRAFRWYVKLNLPTDVTHTFASFQSNYRREHVGRVRGWPAARRKPQHGREKQRPQSGVWSEGRVPLNPVTRCSCSGSHGRVGSEATACRGSDTLLLLNEANTLERQGAAAGGWGV